MTPEGIARKQVLFWEAEEATMLVSKPVVPEAPAAEVYSVSKLELFPRHTRATYQEAFGEQAPGWNPDRRIKRWFDTSVLEGFTGDAANEVAVYDVFDAASPTGTRRLVLTLAEAATPNLPGKVVYPKHTTRPAEAVIVGGGGEQRLSADGICEYSEAVALATELGLGIEAVTESVLAGEFSIRWGGETRRPWVIRYKGAQMVAAALLRQKHANGIGAPGHWDLTPNTPWWIPDNAPTGESDLRPETPMPVRKLRADERLMQGFGGLWMVRRETQTGPAEADLLEKIAGRVEAIAKYLGV